MSSVHKRAHKAPLLLSRKFLDEAITGEEIGAGPICKATVRERGEGERHMTSETRWEKEERDSERKRGERVSGTEGRGDEGEKVSEDGKEAGEVKLS